MKTRRVSRKTATAIKPPYRKVIETPRSVALKKARQAAMLKKKFYEYGLVEDPPETVWDGVDYMTGRWWGR